MIYAENSKGEIIEATSKGINGFCPTCKEKVYSKFGYINKPHFCHYNSEDCDTWSEGETQWHIQWKKRVSKENTEVTIQNHRADIKLNTGLVIELQNSPINKEMIEDREEFYKYMIWLINGISIAKNFIIKTEDKEGNKLENYTTFRWKWSKRSWNSAKKPLYLDLGKDIGVYQIKKLYSKGGWGYLLSYVEFCKKYGLQE